MPPETRYAKSGNIHIAYQEFGSGPIELLIVPGFVSNVDLSWEQPDVSRELLRMGTYARVVMLDKRGTGMSDRSVEIAGLDERMDDLRAVMDAAKMQRAAVLGISEGGSLSMLFAGTYPDRCTALVLFGAYARSNPTAVEAFLKYIEEAWGSGRLISVFAPSRAGDPTMVQWWKKVERFGASPSAASALLKMNGQINVRDILPSIRVPTLVIHRTGDRVTPVQAGRSLAKHIPGATMLELPGEDHLPYIGDNADAVGDAIEEFLTGTRKAHGADIDRVLATVAFTDIVGSTVKAASLGDHRWRALLAEHDKVVRRNIARFRGREVKTTGDGFFVAFDGPARGVRCACTIADEVRALDLEVRAGVHTGECEVIGDDYGGLAVHIGARVAALAGPGEVLVSSTVKDLVAGSGLRFDDRGTHLLKGVPGDWHIFAAAVH
jgi:class 3 adenylate cyclase